MKKHLHNLFKSIWILSILILISGCSDDDTNVPLGPKSAILVSNYSLALPQGVQPKQLVTISGQGFESGDILVIQQVNGGEFQVSLSDVTAADASFQIPDNILTGIYQVTLKRGGNIQRLGSLDVNIIVEVPDKEGATIKGKVFSGTTPLAGVRVSDGYITTTTDANGYYWLQSAKTHGYVFITLPSGYQPAMGSNVVPRFWASLSNSGNVLEQHDFSLTKVNNDKHVILAATDLHVANRGTTVNDMNQFKQGFMVEADQFIKSQTVPVYALILGDMTWDYYWYTRSFALTQYRDLMSSFAAPMFHVMGNHDNDPYYPDDFAAEAKYKKVFGPTYYSMNIGKIHYIVLDNTVYTNSGASVGTMGDRDYKKYFTQVQLQWLKDDLAAITDKSTPIIVGYHCPTFNNYNATFANSPKLAQTDVTNFVSCFTGFEDVNFLNGHSHYMANMDLTSLGVNVLEQNITAVCETWWWSGGMTPGMNVCTDGSPSGYKVFDIDGRNIEWYFKGLYADKSKQFRAYDMNKVKEFFAKTEVAAIMSKVTDYKTTDYGSLPANSVLLNVWDYDDQWEITVKDKSSGQTLNWTRKLIQDPLHRLVYEYTRALKDGKTDTFNSEKNSHMFLIETDNATSSLEIVVKNRFGKTFTETLVRPKDFTYSMQ